MAVENRIKWRRQDYLTLGRAVANFNKKINELNAEERKLYLPDTIEYKEVKENITTRKELNRIMNSLRRFSKQGAEDLYTTKAGEQITKWERQELGIQSRIAQNRLRLELKELNKPNEEGFSRVQMGSIREKEIKAQLRNLKQIENKKGYEFNKLRNRIQHAGTSDYIMKKAIVFQENYLNEMKKYKDFDNYDKLMLRLKAVRNPVKFFEYVSQNEIVGDLTYQSDQYFSQQEFNRFVEEFGVDTQNEEVIADVIGELDEMKLL